MAGAGRGKESPGDQAKATCVDSGAGWATATEQSQDTESFISPVGGAQLSSVEVSAGSREWRFVIRTREVLWGEQVPVAGELAGNVSAGLRLFVKA